MNKQLKELYQDYDNAMEHEEYVSTSKIHETITDIQNVCGEVRYMVTDTELDIYIWDTVKSKTVAAATFENDYCIETDEGIKYYDT